MGDRERGGGGGFNHLDRQDMINMASRIVMQTSSLLGLVNSGSVKCLTIAYRDHVAS